MANTLTGLIPSLFAGLDTVSRELAGFIPSVARDATADRAAVGQSVNFHIAPAGNVSDVSPAMQVPEPTDQTVGNDQIVITKSRAAEFGFVGEERLGLDNNGAGFSPVQADMFAQGLRALVNEIETDLSVEATANASRAHGTPGTLVFQTNINDVSQLGKILSDNGAPFSERQLVINTTAGASLRTLYGINTDRDFSTMPFNQQGVLVTPHGMAIRETGQGQTHAAGTTTNATTDDAGYAVGATTINLAVVAGGGSILAGDVITFAGDSNQYVVESGDADTSDGGTITIQEPGLRQAIPAAATAITVLNDAGSFDAAGIAFYRNAIVLASRAPALPEGGDAASDSMMLTDPRSGLGFEVRTYRGYRKVRFEVAMAWGVKMTQPRHSALLIS